MPTTSYTDTTFSANVIGARTDSAGAAVSDLSAEEARLPAQILTEGYLTPATAFQVQAQTVPDMTVKVGSGTAKADHYVVAGETSGQGNYLTRLDVASVNVTIDAADASQTRTDEIYLVVRDNVYDTSSRALPQIGYRKGDLGGANPGVDSAWKASVLLARVTVAAAATTITSGAISDQRTQATLITALAVTDHGALTGLADDDHTQYLTQARGDARYYTESEADTLLAGKSSTAHTHTALGSLTLTGSLTTTSYVKAGTTLYVGTVSTETSISQITDGLKANGHFTVDNDLVVEGTVYSAGSLGAINGTSDRTSPYFGVDGSGSPPYMRLFWNGSSFQFVRTDTNTVVKTFIIDHPTDADRYLVHATTESPHNGVEYWGVATLEDGVAEVALPPYFEALCAEAGRAVLLTPVAPDAQRKRPKRARPAKARERDAPAPQADGVPVVAATYPRGGVFVITASGNVPETCEVSWLVKAIRKDVPPLLVEPARDEVDIHGEGPYRYYTAR